MLIGMDIGYSNLKLSFGNNNDDLEHVILPVGVVLDERDDGFKKSGDSFLVNVDGLQYIAGLSPSDISLDYQRVLHKNYPSSIEYKALFHASLLKSGADTIDVLVTGLPVDQFRNKEYRSQLEAQLTGKHEVQKGVFITVNKVAVIPQPLGGYILETANNDDMHDSLTLVIDPGFFSVDWTVLQEGSILKGALGTSKKAVSSIFENALKIILNEHGGRTSINAIEKSIVSGKGYIRVFGKKVSIKPILKAAAKDVGESFEKELASMLRESNIDIDIVFLVGGGASLYEEITRHMFPHSEIIISNNSVQSNAHGFWQVAKGLDS